MSETISDEPLGFDEWLNKNYDDLVCEAAESGLDRELNFDRGRFEDARYDDYLTGFDTMRLS